MIFFVDFKVNVFRSFQPNAKAMMQLMNKVPGDVTINKHHFGFEGNIQLLETFN